MTGVQHSGVTLLLFWVGVSSFASALFAGKGPDQPVGKDEIALLIQQLGSEDYPVRERATRRLEGLSDQALGPLRNAARTSESPEIRLRASRIIAAIENRSWLKCVGTSQHGGVVRTTAISPDGKLVASGSEDGSVCLWDADRMSLSSRLVTHRSYVQSVCFSPDGQYLLVGGGSVDADKTLCLWSVKDGKEIHRFEDGDSPFHCVGFSPNGRLIIAGSGQCSKSAQCPATDTVVRVWDVKTGKEVRKLQGHKEPVSFVGFIGDQSILSASIVDLHIWRNKAETPNRLQIVDAERVLCVALSRNGKLAVTAHVDRERTLRRSLRVWDIEKCNVLRNIDYDVSEDGIPTCVAVSDDGTLLVGEQRGWITVWNVTSGNRIGRFVAHDENIVTSIQFAPNHQYMISSSHKGDIKRWIQRK